MNLFNRKILQNRITTFDFPTDGELRDKLAVVDKWQKSLKDSDLGKTKEKSVQGLFLQKFFNEILGYTDKASGESEYNLIAEPKTEVDAQKADGSLGFFTANEKVTKAILELKDAKTQLDKKQQGREKGYTPIEQAYLYATKFDRCDWIIVSNFREVRIYNKQRTQDYYEKFDVLELHKEDEFKRFYYLLHKSNLISKDGKSVIDELFEKTDKQQEDISKEFYNKFKEARLELFDHLVKHNPAIEKPLLFEKAQKILDRIIFILFSEDTGNLLPTGILKQAYELGLKSRDRSDERIWREIKNLFMDIDEGRSDIDPTINRYNGGLFAKDNVLDNLQIKDSIWQSVISLSSYDFESDLNVNILGHIFEQSISDIEEIKVKFINVYENIKTGEISEEPASIKRLIEKEGKRKKEGIYYTPEYITKYIVENTVGKYLEEHPDKLQTIKILDPACGSGAFLNQAHSYLLGEYRNRFEQKVLERHEKQENLSIFDINVAENNRSILLNNLFGVDLNKESVEITKLSLWLKTARSSEPLQNLDKNIKSGNSLVDDPEVAGDKAFKWESEFEEIMKDGGFDVIIGNPPYVSFQNINAREKLYFDEHYSSAKGKYDLYILFIEQSLNKLSEGGYFSMILPNKFLKSNYGLGIKDILLKQEIISIIDFNDLPVFKDATTYPLIITLRKRAPTIGQKVTFQRIRNLEDLLLDGERIVVKQTGLSLTEWVFEDTQAYSVLEKINRPATKLKDLSKQITQGLRTGALEIYYRGKDDIVEKDLIQRVYTGKNVKAYVASVSKKDSMIIPYKDSVPIDLDSYPKAKAYFESNKGHLLSRKNSGKLFKETKKPFFEFWDYNPETKNPGKIVFPDISIMNNFLVDEVGLHYLNTCYAILLKDPTIAEALTVILNSRVVEYFIHSISPTIRGGYYRYKTSYVERIPIPEITEDNRVRFKEYYFRLASLIKQRDDLLDLTLELLDQEYNLGRNNRKLSGIHNLGWNELCDLIANKGFDLNLKQKEELQLWFRGKQKQLSYLMSEIDKLKARIDQEVYALYGLTEKEAMVIESSYV